MSKVKTAATFVKGVDELLRSFIEKKPAYNDTTATEELRQHVVKNILANPSSSSNLNSVENIAAQLPAISDSMKAGDFSKIQGLGSESNIIASRNAAKTIEPLTNQYAQQLGMKPVLDDTQILHLLNSSNPEDRLIAAQHIQNLAHNRIALHTPGVAQDFYPLKAELNTHIANALDINPDVLHLSSGFGSLNAGPMVEFGRVASAGANALRDKSGLSIAPGANWGGFAENVIKGLDDVIKKGTYEDKVAFINNKIFNYTGSIKEANLINDIALTKNEAEMKKALENYRDYFKSYTVDTMDLRAAHGLVDKKIRDISGSPLREVLHSGIGKGTADVLREPRSSAQANIWFPSRILTSTGNQNIPASFSPVSANMATDLLRMYNNKGTLSKIGEDLAKVQRTANFAGQEQPGAANQLSELEQMIINAIAGGQA